MQLVIVDRSLQADTGRNQVGYCGSCKWVIPKDTDRKKKKKIQYTHSVYVGGLKWQGPTRDKIKQTT